VAVEKRNISGECNDIIRSAKESQISETYLGEVEKGKRVDVYLESSIEAPSIYYLRGSNGEQ
jgi:hypothetical protein